MFALASPGLESSKIEPPFRKHVDRQEDRCKHPKSRFDDCVVSIYVSVNTSLTPYRCWRDGWCSPDRMFSLGQKG